MSFMPTNTLGWIFLAIMAISMLWGLATGFVRTVFSTFGLVIVVLAATAGAPILSSEIQSTWLGEQVEKTIEDMLFDEDSMFSSPIEGEYSGSGELIDQMNLPELVKEILEIEKTIDNTIEQEEERVRTEIVRSLTETVLGALCFALIAFAAWILLTALVIGLDLVAKLPVLGTLNHLGGFLIGFLRGYLLIWVFCIVITVLSGTSLGSALYSQINESPILSLLFNSNLPMRIMYTFFG